MKFVDKRGSKRIISLVAESVWLIKFSVIKLRLGGLSVIVLADNAKFSLAVNPIAASFCYCIHQQPWLGWKSISLLTLRSWVSSPAWDKSFPHVCAYFGIHCRCGIILPLFWLRGQLQNRTALNKTTFTGHGFHSFFSELSHSISEEGNGNVERARCISWLVFSDKKTRFTQGNNFIVAYLKRRNQNSSFLYPLNFARTMTSYLEQCGFLVIEL